MNMKNNTLSIIWQDPCICQKKKHSHGFPFMSSRLVLETNLMMVGKAWLYLGDTATNQVFLVLVAQSAIIYTYPLK